MNKRLVRVHHNTARTCSQIVNSGNGNIHITVVDHLCAAGIEFTVLIGAEVIAFLVIKHFIGG